MPQCRRGARDVGVMANTVFFAWQLDTPSEHNKAFIWAAIEAAAKEVGSDVTPELAPRPESDTQGVPGSPNIPQIIFQRISACSIFVADLTFVSTTATGRKVPNPNVLIELGYAARSIGWDRTILVINTLHGEAKALPFDILQHRWPMEFRVGSETQVREKKFTSLKESLAAALRDCEEHQLVRAASMADSLDGACLDFIAQNESAESIDVYLGSTGVGRVVAELNRDLAIRRLIEIGALQMAHGKVQYSWTYDGLLMIQRLNKVQPKLMERMRAHRSKQAEESKRTVEESKKKSEDSQRKLAEIAEESRRKKEARDAEQARVRKSP